jgi:SnoaL-like domain
VQTTHPGTIQVEGDTATGRAYIAEFGRLREGSSHLNYAVYHDRYQRTPDGWKFADGTEVEILNVVDDHSRLLVASRAFVTTKAADVVATFHLGAATWGYPASLLTDNGAIFTAQSRNGTCAIELELIGLGPSVPSPTPSRRATSTIVLSSSSTIATASRLNSSVKLRRVRAGFSSITDMATSYSRWPVSWGMLTGSRAAWRRSCWRRGCRPAQS